MRNFCFWCLLIISLAVCAKLADNPIIGTWYSHFDGDYGVFTLKDNGTCELSWYKMPKKILFDHSEGKYTIKGDVLTVRWTKSKVRSSEEFEPWTEAGKYMIVGNTFKWEGGSEVWTRNP